MTNVPLPPELLELLRRLERRLDVIEHKLDAIAGAADEREAALREQLAIKRQELEALGAQGLHVVDQLDAARQRIKSLEAKG